MFCSSLTPTFFSVLIMTNMLCSNVSLKYYLRYLEQERSLSKSLIWDQRNKVSEET